MNGSGFEHQWSKDFTGPEPTQLLAQWVSGVSGGRVKWQGRVIEHPHTI